MKKVEIFQKKQEFEKMLGEGAELIKPEWCEYWDGSGYYTLPSKENPSEKDVYYWDGVNFHHEAPFGVWMREERVYMLQRFIDKKSLVIKTKEI